MLSLGTAWDSSVILTLCTPHLEHLHPLWSIKESVLKSKLLLLPEKHLALFILSFQFISLHSNDPKEGCHFVNTIWLNFDEGFESLWQMGAFCMAAFRDGDERPCRDGAWPVFCPEGLYTWAGTAMKNLVILRLDGGVMEGNGAGTAALMRRLLR